MIYISSLGIGVKKHENRMEAIEKSKDRNRNAVIVGMSLDEYDQLLRKNEKELSDMDYKVQVEQDKTQKIKLLAQKEIDKRDSEIERLQNSIETQKDIVARWKRKAQGEKGVTQKKNPDDKSSIQSVTIMIGARPKRFDTRIVIETKVPSNMPFDRIKEYFSLVKIEELVPDLEDPKNYRILEVSCGNQKDVWNVVILK